MINLKNIFRSLIILPFAFAATACGGDDNDEPKDSDSRFGQQNAIISITVSPDLLLAADIYCEYNDFEGNIIKEPVTVETRDLIVTSSEPVFQSDVKARLVCQRKDNFIPDSSKELNFSWSLTAIGSIVSKDGTPWAECMPQTVSYSHKISPEGLDMFFSRYSANMATLTIEFRRSGNNYSVAIR